MFKKTHRSQNNFILDIYLFVVVMVWQQSTKLTYILMVWYCARSNKCKRRFDLHKTRFIWKTIYAINIFLSYKVSLFSVQLWSYKHWSCSCITYLIFNSIFDELWILIALIHVQKNVVMCEPQIYLLTSSRGSFVYIPFV